jgi:hypothetical protein
MPTVLMQQVEQPQLSGKLRPEPWRKSELVASLSALGMNSPPSHMLVSSDSSNLFRTTAKMNGIVTSSKTVFKVYTWLRALSSFQRRQQPQYTFNEPI